MESEFWGLRQVRRAYAADASMTINVFNSPMLCSYRGYGHLPRMVCDPYPSSLSACAMPVLSGARNVACVTFTTGC